MSQGSQPTESAPVRQQSRSRGLFSSELADLFVPPLKVGGWSGTAGVLAGVGVSIFRETSPVVWGTVTGLHWFTLGTSFWFTRSMAVKAMGGEENASLSDRTKASAMAGTVAGAMGGLIRGPRNILTSMALWTVLGAGGQMAANRSSTRKPTAKDEDNSWMGSRWSPLKKLTDQEYLDLMGEKMLRLEADIALIDDRIAELRVLEQEQLNEVPSNTPPSPPS